MNTSFNIRFQSTEEKIQRALFSLLKFRHYNDISIKELCYEAGVNRSTFYAHYDDINDLMIKTESVLFSQITDIFKPNIKWDEKVFVKLFEFLFANRIFYKSYLETNEQAFMEKNDFTTFIKIINQKRDVDFVETEKTYHMAFFAGGLKALAKAWLKNNCKETPEQMAKIITNEYKTNSQYFV